jgi:hypothetical protein
MDVENGLGTPHVVLRDAVKAAQVSQPDDY